MLLAVLILCSLALACAWIPVPSIGHIHICYDFACLEGLMNESMQSEVVIIGVLTHNLQKDTYCSLYLGGIQDLFDIPELSVHTVIFEAPEGTALEYAGARMIQLLPPRSIFISHEHGVSSFGILYLEQLKKLGIGPRIVYHMNHERPWNTLDHRDMNYIYNSTQGLIHSYKMHPLVLRNYFYEPLLSSSEYVPLGAPYYSVLLGTPASEYFNARLKPASQRAVKCHFAGRLQYFTTLLDKSIIEVSTDEPHIQQRRQLLNLSAEGRLGGCIAESTDGLQSEMGGEAYYRFYIQKMAETGFAICPAGNNPETFRLYEALEVGAIPIMTRPLQPDQDFLRHELWSNYPGPILNDWSELEAFMLGMTPEKTDQLQQVVGAWYAEFKQKTKQSVRALLIKALEGASNKPTVATEPAFAVQSEPQVKQEHQQSHVENVEPHVTTVEEVFKHLYSQIESLHHRLSEVERELSGSLLREQQLLALLRDKKILE